MMWRFGFLLFLSSAHVLYKANGMRAMYATHVDLFRLLCSAQLEGIVLDMAARAEAREK